jgi:hypothetical protein
LEVINAYLRYDKYFIDFILFNMKHTYALGLAILTAGALIAQSPRFMVAEAFSNAGCGPCAQQNPAYGTLLGGNTDKVVGVKYQTAGPGFDPMNVQNPTDVNTRASYYGITGVPYGVLDGTAHTGSSYLGALANLNQSKINTRYAVTSPFDLQVTHTISPDLANISISVTITATEDINIGSQPMILHVLIAEREITFATAPGTNGETTFKGIMRKMYPNASGTTLSSSWTDGTSQTVTFTETLPTYLYKISEVGVVAFIQNNTTKEVLQGGYSAPAPLADYGAVTAIAGPSGLNCTGDLSGVNATIRNLGNVNMTSATVNYAINGGTSSSFPYTGSIAPNATANVAIPNLTGLTGGTNTLSVWLTQINGNSALTSPIGTQSKDFNVSGAPTAGPAAETFESTSFPTNWIIDNQGASVGWQRVQGAGGFGASNRCMRAFFWNMPNAATADLFTPRFDLSNSGPMQLEFDVAYTYWTAGTPENDRLRVDYSTNCGSTWTNLFDKAGTALSTAPPVGSTSNPFVPSATQWRKETVDLSAINANDVLFRFRGISAFGDNLYVDNINVTAFSASIDENNTLAMSVFPNPASDATQLQFTMNEMAEVTVKVLNMAGQAVITHHAGELANGPHQIQLNTAGLSSGVYQIAIGFGTKTEYTRLVVVR